MNRQDSWMSLLISAFLCSVVLYYIGLSALRSRTFVLVIVCRSLTLTGWYVMARPEGKRVLVISAKGETVARQMCGAITHRCVSFPSCLHITPTIIACFWCAYTMVHVNITLSLFLSACARRLVSV